MNQLKRVSVRRAELSHSLEELTPAGTESPLLRQQIIGALRRAIELGTLKAGERLVEKDLCTKFDVSRPSMREALRDLEANGVVSKVAARTLVITPLSPEDMINISRVRAAVEAMVAEEFIKSAGDADIVALRAALKRLRSADPASGASLDANRDYYESWCKGAGNGFAFGLLMNIQLRLAAVRSKGMRIPQLRSKSLEYHQGLVECMVRRSVKEARELVRRYHREATLALIEAEEEPAPDAAPRRALRKVK